MSIINRHHERLILHRHHVAHVWEIFLTHYAGDDPWKWKALAMLALKEIVGWTHENIGRVFGHPRGHVSRCLDSVKRQLAMQFALADDVFEPPQLDELPEED
ncbi:MAG: hypothetical protein KatS3mg114_1402 [Planctomycetaceae bacterium]|nr:MAG: hypothetical protein KatS3mg114_1402 [Planctomycetaceae bacterium]